MSFMSPVDLGVVRLSVFRGVVQQESTSPERQKADIIKKFATLGVAEKDITWAVDLDVSAFHVPPLKRPQLRRAFNQLPPGSRVVFWKLDRFVRRVFPDFSEMISYASDHTLSLFSATEQLDLSGTMGMMVATNLAFIAEMESRNTGLRVKSTRSHLSSIGRWPGGMPTYGFKPVRVEGKPGWYLDEEPASAAILRELVAKATAGHSRNSLAHWLNENGVLVPIDRWRVMQGKPRLCECGHDEHDEPCGQLHKCHHRRNDGRKRYKLHEYDECSEPCEKYRPRTWSESSLIKILRSPGICGYSVRNRTEIVRDVNGDPVSYGPEVIPYADFLALQTKLVTAQHKKIRTATDSLLLNIAECDCGNPLYLGNIVRNLTTGEKTFNYYRTRHKSCPENRRMIPVPQLDGLVVREMLTTLGDLEVLRKEEVTEARGALEKQRQEIAAQIVELTQEIFVQGTPRANHAEIMTGLQAEHARLTAEMENEGRYPEARLIPTGVKFRDKWDSMDTLERRLWMMDAGVTVVAVRGQMPPIDFRRRKPGKRSMIIGSEGDVFAVIYLGNLGELLRRAGGTVDAQTAERRSP